MNRVLLMLIFSLTGKLIIAQNSTPLALSVGDKMSNVNLRNILNDKNGGNLLDYAKNVILIIDFWATHCVPCVRNLPYLDSLEKVYNGRVKVLAVTPEKRTTVLKFVSNKPFLRNLQLKFVTDDSLLSKYFPHRIIPHEVWIDKYGFIIAITSDLEVTAGNINKVLTGTKIDLPKKIDDLYFDNSKPYFINGNFGDGSDFLYRTVLTKYNPALASGGSINMDSMGRIWRLACYNNDPLHLFSIAYNKSLTAFVNRNRMVVDSKDSVEYLKWVKEKSYCYELIVPEPLPADSFYKYMFQDLNKYFKISVTAEKRKVPCWAIIRLSHDTLNFNSEIKQVSMDDLMKRLNDFYQLETVVNESGYSGLISEDLLKCVTSQSVDEYPNISLIKTCINKYGFDLIKTNREIEVLVVRDKK
jgi:thiol-disulfide isomerase/thioredoxin